MYHPVPQLQSFTVREKGWSRQSQSVFTLYMVANVPVMVISLSSQLDNFYG